MGGAGAGLGAGEVVYNRSRHVLSAVIVFEFGNEVLTLFSIMEQSPNQYDPPVWRKSQIGDAESGADIERSEQYLCVKALTT